MIKKIMQLGSVCQIAAPFTGDAELTRHRTHLFQKKHLGAALGRTAGGQQARGPTPYYHD